MITRICSHNLYESKLTKWNVNARDFLHLKKIRNINIFIHFIKEGKMMHAHILLSKNIEDFRFAN